MNNFKRIICANNDIACAYSQGSLIWGEKLIRHTVRLTISIPEGVDGTIHVYLNDRLYSHYKEIA